MKNPARTSAHSVFPPIDYSRNAEVLAHPARRLTTALMTAGLVIGLLAAISTTRAAHALPLKPLMDSFSEATLRGQSTAGNPSMTAVSGKNVKTQPWASRPLYGGTTLTVTNNGDDGTPGAGTLREALDFQANSCYMGPIAIHFAIPTGGPASDYVITPASPLPPITCSNTTIDGYTQSGATANTLATGSDANIAITLDGAALAGSSPGLTLNADYLAVRGLIVYNFTVYPGIEIVGGTGASITGNSIVGNGFGVKMMGGEGVYIGGSLPSERNTISSNDAGILLGSASGQTGSQIINNYIGTAASGSGGAPNGSNNAIEVYIPDTIIANNLIAYNLGAGIGMLEGPAYIHDNNIFANLQGGVRVYANECAPQGVSIRANNIGFPNGGGQGIALGDVLQGDARDDNGLLNSPNCYHANGGQPGSPAFAQNYPVITAVNYAWNGASVVTTIDAVLDSAADTTYDIDLFDNTYTVDTANIGIGAKYLLTVPSTTDGSGHTAIQMIASGTPVYYPSMTASTPFGPTGGTSEFSVQGLTSLIYTSAPYTSYSIAAGGTQSQTFTFRNDDAQPISVPVPTFNQPEFSVTSPPCGMVAPGATCSVVVAFGTATAGTVGGTMTIGPVSSASAAVAPVTSQPVQSFIFALTGTATAGTPAASIAGTGTFPNVTVGGASAVQTVTITNSGSANLLLNTLTVSVSGIFVDTTSGAPPNAAHWCGFGSTASGDPLTAPPITLAPGASCALNLIFKPSAAISYSATLTINTNATPSSSTFALSGTGIAAAPPTMAVSFNPTSVVVGGTSTMTITLANSAASKADVNGTSSVTIPANLNFAGIGTNTCVATPNQAGQVFSFTNGTVPPMGTCTFDVPVQSAVPGTYTINIGPGQLFTTQGNNTNSSSNALTVTSTPTPGVTLSPPSVAFGARTVNTTSPPSTVTLSNSGGAPLTISSITSSGDFAVVSSCPLGPSTLGVGLNCPLDITFTPLTVSASLNGNVTIVSDAPGSPHIVPLSGAGTATPVPTVTLNTTLLNFFDQLIGTPSAALSISVYNSGFATLNISNISLIGNPAFSRVFAFAPAGLSIVGEGLPTAPLDCSFSVPPGSSCNITIVFTPTAVGAAAGQVSISTNAAGSPHIINLIGNGISNAVPTISVANNLNFGDQIITTGGTQTLNITNGGGAPLTVSSLTISGTNASNFVTSGTCASVVANASCPILITFTPTTVGAKSAQLTIASNASNLPTATITLSGTGILAPRPIVELSATTIGYGNAIFGGASGGQVITLNNTGGTSLQIQNLFASGDFVVMSSCPAQLAGGASCVINVTFNPLGVGQRTGELVLVTNAQGSPHRIPLTGTGCRWFSQGQSRFFLTTCG